MTPPARRGRPRRPAAPPGPALVLTAHGSVDPRSAQTTQAIAGRIRRLRPWLDVRPAFLEKCAPGLGEVLGSVAAEGRSAVVVPMLLASAYHATVDIPGFIDDSPTAVAQAEVLGEDPALVRVLGQRLTESGVSPDDPQTGVVVTAVGSSNAAANARTATVAARLGAGTRWAGVTAAFATGPSPSVPDAVARLRGAGARRIVIAPWFLAHGRITDRVAGFARSEGIPMSAPLGSHNLVAATLLDRYDSVLACRAAA